MYYDIEKTGKRIRQLRKDKGITQEQLADELHVSDRHIRSIEAGKCGTSVDILAQLSVLWGVSLDYLVLGKQFSSEDLRQKVQSAMQLLAEVGSAL